MAFDHGNTGAAQLRHGQQVQSTRDQIGDDAVSECVCRCTWREFGCRCGRFDRALPHVLVPGHAIAPAKQRIRGKPSFAALGEHFCRWSPISPPNCFKFSTRTTKWITLFYRFQENEHLQGLAEVVQVTPAHQLHFHQDLRKSLKVQNPQVINDLGGVCFCDVHARSLVSCEAMDKNLNNSPLADNWGMELSIWRSFFSMTRRSGPH